MFSFSSISLSPEMNQPPLSSKMYSSRRNRSDSYPAWQSPTWVCPKQEATAASCHECTNQNLLDCHNHAHTHPVPPRTEVLPLPWHLALGLTTASKPCKEGWLGAVQGRGWPGQGDPLSLWHLLWLLCLCFAGPPVSVLDYVLCSWKIRYFVFSLCSTSMKRIFD